MFLRQYFSVISFLILFLALSSRITAQTKLFKEKELNTVHNYRILQDHDGFVWMIGEKGVTKYDGTSIRIFTTNDGLPTNDIWNIRITDDNKIWFFSSAREHGYILNDSVHKFSANDSTIDMIPICVVQKRENVGFYNTKGNYIELKDDKWVKINQANQSFKYILEAKGVEYIEYTKDSILLKTTQNETILITKRGTSATYFNIYPGEILFLVVDNTIHVVELNTLKIYHIRLDDYQLNLKHKIGISYVNNDFQLTGNNFVVDLDENFNVENIELLEPNLESYYSMRDKLGNIWVASFNNGIYFISFSETKSKSYDFGSTKELKKINDNIYFVSKKKQFGKFENTIPSIKYYHEGIHDLYTYFSHKGKLNLSANKTYVFDSNYKIIGKTSPNNIKSIYKTKNKIYYTHNYFTDLMDSNNNFIANIPISIKSFSPYKDTLFCATFQGLFFIEKNKVTKHPSNFTHPINTIATTNNGLLLGTDGHGLFNYKNGKIKRLFPKITFVEKIKSYGDSIVLISTNNGLYFLNQKDTTYQLEYIYNINDGLKTNLVNDVLLKEDKLYIATAYGITVINKNARNKNQLQSVYLNNIKWNGTLINDTILKAKFTKNNSIEINFSTINYSIKNYLTYSYKLDPDQDKFIKIPKGQINLNNLPIGDHSLIIKVENDKHVVLTKIISIIIEPNWYQTIWFYLVVGLISIAILFLALQHFLKNVAKKSEIQINQERQLSNFKLQALRSQMNPHFVFNSLNAIQYYINENDTEMSDKYLLKFSRLIRQFFELSNVTEIRLTKEIELLTNYLEIEKMRFLNKLNYEIKIDEEIKKMNFNIPTMILQPIVENAVNHGIFHKKKQGLVIVEFNKINNYSYQIKIKDDGIGIEKSKKIKEKSIKGHNSKSTILFKERIALLNQASNWDVTYQIKNLSDHEELPGTEVILKFTKK